MQSQNLVLTPHMDRRTAYLFLMCFVEARVIWLCDLWNRVSFAQVLSRSTGLIGVNTTFLITREENTRTQTQRSYLSSLKTRNSKRINKENTPHLLQGS